MESKLTQRTDENGLVEFVDENDVVVEKEMPPKGNFAKKKRVFREKGYHKVKQVINHEGKVSWVGRGVNMDNIPHVEWPFSQLVSDMILMHVIEGKSLKDISEMEGFPPRHIIYRWTREHPEFKDHLEIAKRDRASYFHDKALDIAMAVRTKTDAVTAKVKIDTLKWAAEKGSPSDYGNRQVVEGNPDKPITIVVDTGIYRQIPGEINGNNEKEITCDVVTAASVDSSGDATESGECSDGDEVVAD